LEKVIFRLFSKPLKESRNSGVRFSKYFLALLAAMLLSAYGQAQDTRHAAGLRASYGGLLNYRYYLTEQYALEGIRNRRENRKS
jgi:hypothetical protein